MRQDFKDTMRFIQRVAKNSYNSYNDAQVKTREATSNSSSRTTEEMLEAVARYADTEYNAVAIVLWKRLTDYKFRRHVLKSLIVIEFLMMRAGEQFMADVVERMDVIRRLKMFKYFKNGERLDMKSENKPQESWDCLRTLITSCCSDSISKRLVRDLRYLLRDTYLERKVIRR